EKMSDLKGKKIRSAPNYNRFFDELGITSSMIDPSEVYTSLQTGVVDGLVYGGQSGPRDDGWTESVTYVLAIPFCTQNAIILMNKEAWDTISQEDEKGIMDATAEYEKYMVEYYEDIFEDEREKLEEEGVEFITLPEDEKDKFLD